MCYTLLDWRLALVGSRISKLMGDFYQEASQLRYLHYYYEHTISITMTDTIRRARTAYPSGVPEISPCFLWGSIFIFLWSVLYYI